MIQVTSTITSEDIIDNEFACNLTSCKRARCIEGDTRAPTEETEPRIMKCIYPEVEPYPTDEGRAAIEAQGVYVRGEDGEWETPLINGGERVYVVRNESGWTLCVIEQAYNDKKIDWKKPISYHLYPTRLREYSSFTAVNYHRWSSICDDACALSKELQVPIYKFIENALIRKFEEEWYEESELIAEHLKEEK